MIEFQSGKFRKLILRYWRWALFFVALVVAYPIAVNNNFFWAFGGMPDLKALENPQSEEASEILTADGKSLGKYFIENRTPVEFDQLSPNIIKALVATEDARFLDHSGIDPRSLGRVLQGVLTGKTGSSGGGSTLTQQLAKNLFEIRTDEKYKGWLHNLPVVRTVVNKTKEWILSVRLERNYTKQEIMAMYLNTVSFGNNTYGVKVAAKTYFNKEPWQVRLEEAAMLVGMLQNPSRYNPRLFKERALTRRNVVLSQMKKYGFMTDAEYTSSASKPLKLNFTIENHNSGPAPYFREALRDYLNDWITQYNDNNNTDLNIYTSGLRIYTTVDSRMQQYGEEAMETNMRDQQKKFFAHWKALKMRPWTERDGRTRKLKEAPNFIAKMIRKTGRYQELKRAYGDDTAKIWKALRTPSRMKVFTWNRGSFEKDTMMSSLDSLKYYLYFLRSAFVSMDPRNGDIKAYVGGINFKYFKYDQARQGSRQPGSTFKPFLYCTAIDNSYVTPCETVIDQQVCIGNWCPKNSDGRFSGRALTLRQALGKSINSVSAYLIKRVGPVKTIEYAHKLGIKSYIKPDYTIALGSCDVKVLEMINAYCTFANGGNHVEPRLVTRIEDKDGNILAESEFTPKLTQVISEQVAYQMLFLMRGATEDPGGTAMRLRGMYKLLDYKNEISAKTGTTSEYSDGWFMGVTPNLVSGVWVGGESNKIHFTTMDLGQGARMAMPAWAMYMQKVYKDPELGGITGMYRPEKFQKPQKMDMALDCASPYRNDSTNTYLAPTVTDDEGVIF